MNLKQRLEIFQRFQAQNPHPETELHFSSDFELLVAVILSAQATDKRVNIVTQQLFPIANTPEKILALGEPGLKKYIQSIGLYNAKAANIIKTSQLLVEKYHSQIPRQREELESLPGVGRKTANVILNTLFGDETIAVDTHIFRVANRTGLARGKNVWEVEQKLLKAVPPEFRKHAHHWLVLHGRYVCTARKPKCPQCLIRDLCEYDAKTEELCV
jgi:endonuclease-3